MEDKTETPIEGDRAFVNGIVYRFHNGKWESPLEGVLHDLYDMAGEYRQHVLAFKEKTDAFHELLRKTEKELDFFYPDLLDKKDLRACVATLEMVTSDNILFYDSEPFGELLNVVVQDIDSLRKEIKKEKNNG